MDGVFVIACKFKGDSEAIPLIINKVVEFSLDLQNRPFNLYLMRKTITLFDDSLKTQLYPSFLMLIL